MPCYKPAAEMEFFRLAFSLKIQIYLPACEDARDLINPETARLLILLCPLNCQFNMVSVLLYKRKYKE